MDKQYWVYIISCQNGAYYTGYTTDLIRRYQEHVNGTGKCKYTRSFKPVELVQSWCVNSQSQAMKIEKLIKKLSRQEKIQLILEPNRVYKKNPVCLKNTGFFIKDVY